MLRHPITMQGPSYLSEPCKKKAYSVIMLYL